MSKATNKDYNEDKAFIIDGTMKRLFKENMTWTKLIIYSVASAVVVAVLNCIPALQGTSFTAPAETTEIWVPLALWVILKCKKYTEAMVKTFVYFLISQPLIYLIEVPFKDAGWELFSYYPFWGVITVLTIPGAAVAYRVKKGDILSALIVSVANGIVLYDGLYRFGDFISSFPHYTITLIFCIVTPIVFIFTLLKEKRPRIVAIIIYVILFAVGIFMFVVSPDDFKTNEPLDEGEWTLVSVSDDGLTAAVTGEADSQDLDLASHKAGEYKVILKEKDGTEVYYIVTVAKGDHYISTKGPYDVK